MIEKVNLKKAKEIYNKYLNNDFKDNEIPNEEDYLNLVKEERSMIYVYKKLINEEEKEVAYFITMEKNDIILITHLAVIEEYRGKGIGTEFIKSIEEFFNSKKMIIVEVESKEMAKNEKELDKIIRRQKYYLKAGFKKYDKIDYRLFGNIYDILIYHIQQKDISETNIKENIQKIYGEEITKKYLKIKILD